ncbi:MAG: futalosine hydrolase [Bacteroidetes bacterium]|nr:futalosine hydrolase [Bacteroidota bacterium]
MQILVTASTEMEIAPFVNENHETDILITGVGVPATLYQLSKRLHQVDYDLVVQAGICGSYGDNNFDKCLAVIEDTFADIGIYEANNFFSVFDMGFCDADTFPYQNGFLKNNNAIFNNCVFQKVRALTVNSVGENDKQETLLNRKYNAGIETMEGAALHYVCLLEQVPFLQLRAVSNRVGERDKSKWKIKEAVLTVNNGLSQILEELKTGKLKI